MLYFKIFNREKQAWWNQDGFGYTDEYNARFWPESIVSRMALDNTQIAVPFEPSRITQALIA